MLTRIYSFSRFCLSVFILVFFVTTAFGKRDEHEDYSFDHLPQAILPVFKTDTFSIVKYGARAGGRHLNTQSINNAIIECSNNGGGVVLVPGGLWLTGPIEMRSNVNLHLASNSILLFTKDFDQYKLVSANWEGVPAARNQSPVSAYKQDNIAITGSGVIDGNGDAWRILKREKVNEVQWRKLTSDGGLFSEDKKTWYPTQSSLKGAGTRDAGVLKDGMTVADFSSVKDFLRPNLIMFSDCRKVLLQGVTFQNSPAWTVHQLMCEDVTVKDILVLNPPFAQNGDGIDLESCRNVLLEGSVFDAGDDGICIKSGKDEMGRKANRPCENVVVHNCRVYHAHGGFVIGSEMSGGARNIFVYDCSFIGSDIGLRFKTKRGRGGIVEHIHVRNINMKDIVGAAILFDMYYEAKDPISVSGGSSAVVENPAQPVNEGTPIFRDFTIEQVACVGAAQAIFVRGLPEMNIERVRFDDISISATKGIDIIDAGKMVFNRNNITVKADGPVIRLSNASDITFSQVDCNRTETGIVSVSGATSTDIKLIDCAAIKNKDVVAFERGASPKAVTIK